MIQLLAAFLVKCFAVIFVSAICVTAAFVFLNRRLEKTSRRATPTHRDDFDRKSIHFLASAVVLEKKERTHAYHHKHQLKRFLKHLEERA